jgi:hypothetical protein
MPLLLGFSESVKAYSSSVVLQSWVSYYRYADIEAYTRVDWKFGKTCRIGLFRSDTIDSFSQFPLNFWHPRKRLKEQQDARSVSFMLTEWVYNLYNFHIALNANFIIQFCFTCQLIQSFSTADNNQACWAVGFVPDGDDFIDLACKRKPSAETLKQGLHTVWMMYHIRRDFCNIKQYLWL